MGLSPDDDDKLGYSGDDDDGDDSVVVVDSDVDLLMSNLKDGTPSFHWLNIPSMSNSQLCNAQQVSQISPTLSMP